MAAVTLAEVARRASVSLATASRVLNGSSRTPNVAIAGRVREAADELGYVANAQAQALARAATGLVGIVVHDIADPYFSTIVSGAQEAARRHNRQILIASAERDEAAERDAVSAFISHRTDAIILAGSRREHPDKQLAADLGRYIRNGGRVLTFGPSSIPGAGQLELPNRAGARALVEALIGRGLTRFAILSGPSALSTVRDRIAGLREAMAEAGIEPLAVVEGEFTSRGGYAAAIACWERLQPQERICLLALNDVMALGAMAAMRSLGLTVPGDVQVAGFDDVPSLRYHAPSLTTYRLDLERLGERALDLALDPGADAEPITGEVVLRESTD